MKFICINLKRRTDRREEMEKIFDEQRLTVEFFDAVDGITLKPDLGLLDLFKYNDFGYQRGIIGCALSHIHIWEKLVHDEYNNHYVVLEDDIVMADNFLLKSHWVVDEMRKNDIGIVFIGDSSKNKSKNLHFGIKNNTLKPLPKDNWHGGTYGYVISKRCAEDLMDAVIHHSVHRAIDYFMVDVLHYLKYDVRVLKNPLVYTQVALLTNEVDSDIQREKSTLI